MIEGTACNLIAIANEPKIKPKPQRLTAISRRVGRVERLKVIQIQAAAAASPLESL